MPGNLFAKLTIATRLVGGFGALVILTVVMGGLGLRSSSTLSTLVNDVSAHPLTVLDAALQARAEVIAMHREVQDMVLSAGPEEVEASAAVLSKLERATKAHVQTLRSQYLGPPDDVTEVLQALEAWHEACQATLASMRAGRQDEALATLKHGGAAEEAAEKELLGIVAFARNKVAEFRRAAEVEQRQALLQLTLATVGLVLLGVLLAQVITRSITQPLDVLRGRMGELAAGDLTVEVPYREGRNELAAMAKAVQVFKEAAERLEGRRWVKSNIARLGTALQSATGRHDFCQAAVGTLVPLLGGGAGMLYLWDDASQSLRLAGGYGLKSRGDLAFKLGEGLVGQCALDRAAIVVADVPDDYARIASGLGEAVPRTILLAPVMSKGQVLAVIEIGSFQPFTADQEALIDEALPLVALNLEILHRNHRTQVLLEQTQQQAEELRASEEELTAQSEQLQSANEELRASEEELKAQREELQAANEELEEKTQVLEAARAEADHRALERDVASRYKSEFLANMSHELRTPLNSLLILAGSLADNDEGNLSGDQIESARIIQESGTHLLRLINDILDISKVEAGKMEVLATDIALDGFVESLQRRFRGLAEAKGLFLTVEAASDLPPSLRGDSGKLDQIVNNLVGNALKFTERGDIAVRLTRPRGAAALAVPGLNPAEALAIEVADSGIGIAPDMTDRIFQAFEQADGGTGRRYGGTGLGLTISRKLARFLGGDIVVSSAPGQGSVFTLVVPLVPSTMPAAIPAPLPVAAPPPHRRPAVTPAFVSSLKADDDRDSLAPQDDSILVIEDDETFARIICDLARKCGFKCLIAGDGLTGLDLARSYRPTGIVLDVGLPNLDGWTVMERLKQYPETRHIPVHFMSGADAGRRGLELGAVGFLTKPAKREEIEAAFARIRQVAATGIPRLLMVDDDQATRKAVVALLKGAEVEIVEAASGEEVLARLRRGEQFHCMILDLQLPDIGGLSLFDQCAREGLMPPPVVTYTGRDLSVPETLALREYADSIVIKGDGSPERLLDEVTRFLRGVQDHLPEARRMALGGPQETDRPLAGRTVLVVDDDMRNAFALSKVLRAKGLKVLMAQNGHKALAQLQDAPKVDVVLMDIMMPGMDGYQTMQEIRRQPRFEALPIIALTAKAMVGDREKCLAAGANEYLSKPLDLDVLVAAMRDLVLA